MTVSVESPQLWVSWSGPVRRLSCIGGLRSPYFVIDLYDPPERNGLGVAVDESLRGMTAFRDCSKSLPL